MKPRRGRSHIRKLQRIRKDGSVKVFYEAQPYAVDGTGKRKRRFVYGETWREANEKALALQSKTISRFGAEKQTVSDYFQSWLNANRPNWQPATFKLYDAQVRHHILPHIGAVKLIDMTEGHIEKLFSDKLAGIGARARQHVYKLLRHGLNDAFENSLIASSPVRRKHRPTYHATEKLPFTKAEAARFLEAARADEYYVGFVLALTTGMRRGELLALTWADVNLDDGHLVVRKTLTLDYDGKPTLSDPKASRSRKIDLPPTAVEALRAVYSQRPQDDKSPWILRDGSRGPLDKDKFSRHFHAIRKAADLRHIRFHDLRHTMASLLLGSGENVKVVSERLGHSSAKLTLDVYAHTTPTMQRSAAAKIEAIFANSGLKSGLKPSNGHSAGREDAQTLIKS